MWPLMPRSPPNWPMHRCGRRRRCLGSGPRPASIRNAAGCIARPTPAAGATGGGGCGRNCVEMRAAAKRWIRRLVPAALRGWWRRTFGWRGFDGNYETWTAARAVSTGYDADIIVQRVLAAVQEVRAGRAVFERDGVPFGEPAPDQPLLLALQEAARRLDGRLRVLDFGGSLGSVYWRHRSWLQGLAQKRWDIV